MKKRLTGLGEPVGAVATIERQTNGKHAQNGDSKVVRVLSTEVDIRRAEFTIVGTSSLIMNRWTPKAIEMMEAKQQGLAASSKREKRNPDKEVRERCYVSQGKPMEDSAEYGIPALWVKCAIINAAKRTKKQIPSTDAMAAIYIPPAKNCIDKADGTPLIPLESPSKPRMVRDMVRNQSGVADMRYRPYFDEWSVTFVVEFNCNILTEEQIANLLQIAGWAVGLGEWRREKSGDHGMFKLANT